VPLHIHHAHEFNPALVLMLENPFAVLGIVLQWISSLMLVLLFYRLGQIGTHRRLLWVWAAAWGGQLVSLTGFTLNAVATMAGRPFAEIQSLRWLDGVYYVPGTMLFMTLIGVGVAQAVGRRLPAAVERIGVLAAIAVGLFAVLLGDRVLTGALLVAVTTTVSLGALVRIIASERRRRDRRLLLPGAVLLLGAVMVTYQLIRYFGATLDPLGDFANVVHNLSGYVGVLASALLGAAIIVMVTEDSVRAQHYARQEQLRVVAEIGTQVSPTSSSADPHSPKVQGRSDARYQSEVQRIDAVAIIVEPSVRSRSAVDDAVPLRASPLSARTATLPQSVRQADGSVSLALLIDDEAPARSTLARIFQRGGWAVREAATGAEALNWLVGVDPREAPAVIVCNFTMPGLGGRQFHAHLQQHRPEFLPRLIFATDGLDEATADFIRATGCQQIRKPGTVEDVARAVEQVTLRT
jgi:CheY-like chemotaxis protein